jgi:hypothetical protein
MPYWLRWNVSHSFDWNNNSVWVAGSNPLLPYVALKTLDLANLADFRYQETIAHPVPGDCTTAQVEAELRASPYGGDPVVTTTGEIIWRFTVDPSHEINFQSVQLWNICAHS